VCGSFGILCHIGIFVIKVVPKLRINVIARPDFGRSNPVKHLYIKIFWIASPLMRHNMPRRHRFADAPRLAMTKNLISLQVYCKSFLFYHCESFVFVIVGTFISVIAAPEPQSRVYG